MIEEETSKKARIHALNYLVMWNQKDKLTGEEKWKFNKTRQVWLLKHMYMLERVPSKHFKLLLKYIATIESTATKDVRSRFQVTPFSIETSG